MEDHPKESSQKNSYLVLLPENDTELKKYDTQQALIEKVKLVQTPDWKTKNFNHLDTLGRMGFLEKTVYELDLRLENGNEGHPFLSLNPEITHLMDQYEVSQPDELVGKVLLLQMYQHSFIEKIIAYHGEIHHRLKPQPKRQNYPQRGGRLLL
ncbi:hypothetical protein C0585_04130 [Candidatus Woesearchaeota archaeon]|nr:MAG: hypothetical protein C0585_04130 [Candidatus Woesearchaeota archaeon]